MIRRGFGRVGRPGLLGTVARTAVVAGTATVVSGGVMRRQNERAESQREAQAYEQQQAEAQYQAAAAPVAPTPSGGTDAVLAELTQLGDLKDRGLLTDAEFESQKTRLLAK
jgi:hypothetical protein